MMNARLRAAVTAAENLPDELQSDLAALIEEEMAWDLSFADPRHDAALQRLVAEAEHEIDGGDFADMPGEDEG